MSEKPKLSIESTPGTNTMPALLNLVLSPVEPARDGAAHVWTFTPQATKDAIMPEPRPIQVAYFVGESTLTMSSAIERASRALGDWYKLQAITHLSTGGSIFQFSTAAYGTADEFTFIITVFDTRYAD